MQSNISKVGGRLSRLVSLLILQDNFCRLDGRLSRLVSLLILQDNFCRLDGRLSRLVIWFSVHHNSFNVGGSEGFSPSSSLDLVKGRGTEEGVALPPTIAEEPLVPSRLSKLVIWL